MKKLYKFSIASIKMFFRNRQALFFSLFLPLMIMVIFGVIDFDSMGDVRLEVIDNVKNEQSQNLIDGLKKIEVLKINQNDNLENAKNKLKNGKADVAIDLPPDLFAANPERSAPKEIKVYTSEGSSQSAGLGVMVLREAFNNFSLQITKAPQLFNLQIEAINSRNLRYIDFLVPGVLAMAIMQMGLFSILFVVVSYKKTGVMRRLLVTPVKPAQFVGAQVVTRLIVSLLQVLVIMLVATIVFKVEIAGSYLLLGFLVFWGSIIFLAMGFALSSFAKTEEAAAPIANIIAMPQMFLGNVFFPVESMPVWLQGVVKYLPLNYLADALRKVMNQGAHFSDITKDIWGLIAWSVIAIFLAIVLFRWQEE